MQPGRGLTGAVECFVEGGHGAGQVFGFVAVPGAQGPEPYGEKAAFLQRTARAGGVDAGAL